MKIQGRNLGASYGFFYVDNFSSKLETINSSNGIDKGIDAESTLPSEPLKSKFASVFISMINENS
ncbi:MAG: hypothetical protein ACJA11_003570 [Glaciecola sp.]